MTDYTPKVFTREQPCTKVEIHNCFYAPGGYKARMVIEARTEIGINVPKYLLREGYAVQELRGGSDYLELTEEGEEWLRTGLARQLELHPERRLDCKGFNTVPKKAAAVRIRRTR